MTRVAVEVPIEVDYDRNCDWFPVKVGDTSTDFKSFDQDVFDYLDHAIQEHVAADREQAQANQDEEAHRRALNSEAWKDVR